MELNRKYKIAQTAIVVLCVTCAALSLVVFRNRTGDYSQPAQPAVADKPAEPAQPAQPAQPPNFDSFFKSFNHQLEEQHHSSSAMLDKFFDDDFFNQNQEPFKEMEKLRREMMARMEQSMKGSFDTSWNTWFDDRFTGGGSLDRQMEETPDAYVYHFNFPDLKDRKMNVKVGEDGITISGDFVSKKEDTGAGSKAETQVERRESSYLHFPIPDNADSQKAAVTQKDGEITVRVPKRAAS